MKISRAKEWTIIATVFLLAVIGIFGPNARRLYEQTNRHILEQDLILPSVSHLSNASSTNDFHGASHNQITYNAVQFLQEHKNIDPNKPYMVIHVGPPKTGTSTLRRAFNELSDRGLFAKDNYRYDRSLFVETIMDLKCQRQLMGLRQSHKMEENQYNISEEDLAQKLKSLPCWKSSLQRFQPYKLNKTNLFAMNETWSFDFNTVSTENGNSLIDWESIRLTLMPDWNILLLFTYRRYPEWIFSSFQQINRHSPMKPKLNMWPRKGGRKILPMQLPTKREEMLPIAFRYSDSLKQEMERNEDIPHAIINMHFNDGHVSSLVCGFLPNARHSCEYILQKEAQQVEEPIFNPSVSLFFDALAVAAHEKGLINGTRHKRPEVAMRIQDYHERELKQVPEDFPLICPSAIELEGFLNLSLLLEREIVPEFALMVGVEKEHRSSYWRQVDKNKFCWIDTDAVLRNSTWIDFFKSLDKQI